MLKSKTSQDVSRGVWLELENEEYGWWIQYVSEGLEKGRFYFANNLQTFSSYYETYKLTLWNNGMIDRSMEVPPVGQLVTVPIAEVVSSS